MRSILLAAAIAVLPVSALAATPSQPAPTKATSAWWGHIKVLASNAYEGRLTGSPGYYKAAHYVAGQFKAAGLKPGGDKGSYFQAVKYLEQHVDAAHSSMALVDGTKVTPLAVGPDLTFGSRDEQPKTVEAPMVFIGYGLHLPEQGYDDFAGQDLKGKVVVVLGGGPDTLSAALKSHASSTEFPKALKAAGAVGVIRLQNPKAMDIPWARLISLSSQPGMRLAEPALQTYRGPVFSASLNPDKAEVLFAKSGHSFAELLALADAHKPLPRFPLNQSVKASVVTETHEISSPNVVGVLPGTDPTLKAQYVVVSAHLDHLGVGEPIKGDKVYHGAMDNAAGVAAMIETAKGLKGHKLKRSIVFVAIAGEEKGLLGSKAFAEHPTVPKTAIVADINMDEFLPLFPLKHLLVLGEGESTLGDMARETAKAKGYDTLPDPAPDRNIFVRSDQYSFIKTGVPSVALKVEGLPGSPEAQMDKDWNTYRYHAPQDDLTQPVDLKSADDFDAYLLALLTRVADAKARPVWKADSFFKRFDTTGAASGAQP
ncbi:M20/M25/M40 family metallo-hydrolase [Phenylobacterium sp.]|uniref:M20/M25/M40 family metallo-hydrolase n=1 Tax=Phenylobacterium sp. TaxID=1871053 RepID=UPI002E3241DB|nr:M20/M25/M40 family metallo-hydrolase [Phenylobacterium sp.]HEX3365378.1 M20/M25/M40 family metallo-hydrolase [Phenylobacterium sp.]